MSKGMEISGALLVYFLYLVLAAATIFHPRPPQTYHGPLHARLLAVWGSKSIGRDKIIMGHCYGVGFLALLAVLNGAGTVETLVAMGVLILTIHGFLMRKPNHFNHVFWNFFFYLYEVCLLVFHFYFA